MNYQRGLFAAILLLAGVWSHALLAQPAQSQKLDGVYEPKVEERQIIPYDHIREADVFWQKRVWRIIDSREKMNKTFVYPKKPLITILLDAVLSERITVFEKDEFKTVRTAQAVSEIGAGYDTIADYDQHGNYIGDRVVYNEFDPTTVTKFRIKEDWFFDEETSTMQVRILGIAPLYTDVDLGDIPMFWAYYPDMRPIFVNIPVFNPFNDAIYTTWEDLFEMRLFSSYIMKISNIYERRISDYATDVDGLLEADKWEEHIFNFEHDLWSY